MSLSKVRRNARRLLELYKLPLLNDKIAALEARVADLGGRTEAEEKKNYELRCHVTALTERLEALEALQQYIDSLEQRGAVLERRLDPLEFFFLPMREGLDALKSSREVPQALIDDFHAWKAATPVPERPLVSVCVATYNRGRLLTERCIPSILSQTYDRLELIVVGDGCTDDTEERVARIRDPRLKFVNLTERGKYPSDPLRRWMVAGTQPVNAALALAEGDYIAHLDDDDAYLPERLEKLVAFAAENRADFVWHPFWVETEPDEWVVAESPDFAYSHLTTSSVFYRSWFKKVPWDINAYRLLEPGDWNRFRRIKYINPVALRYPEPLLRHYRERSQGAS